MIKLMLTYNCLKYKAENHSHTWEKLTYADPQTVFSGFS